MSWCIKQIAGLSILLFLMTSVKAQESKHIRIACIGNSVTYGYGLKNRETECYPARLQQGLGKSYEVKNFGHSGATLLKHGHNPYFKTREFTDALNYKPDIAIVHLGLNDTDPRNWPDYKMDFQADYTWLLDTLRKVNPKIKVYVCRLTPIFSGHPRFKSGTRDWYWQIQSCISAVAKGNQTELIDLNTPLRNRPDLFVDQLHPDAEGASIIAQTIFQRITGNFGGLQLASIFNNHMVIQRSRPIPIYGSANAGEQVAVTLGDRKKSVSADQEGKWKVEFPALAAGGPYVMKVQGQKRKMVFQDILIGDVWLCSGQSNMAFPLKSAATGDSELKTLTSKPLLRLFKLEGWKETDNSAWDSVSLFKANQLKFFSGKWSTCTARTAADFTAVGYYFGKQIMQEEGIPIGLIELAVGGSTTESWIDRQTMEHDDLLVDELFNWRKSDFIQPWVRERADTNLKAASNPRQRHPYEPCYNYEAGLDSLTKFQLKGVIWYQGESNTHNVELHDRLFQTLVKSWRQQWGYEFPFYYVQLSSIDRPSWPVFRAAQRKLQFSIPNTAMAVTSDLGDSLNVHPTRKKEVGERLAKLALKYTYQKNIEANGPEVREAVWQGNEIVVSFNHAVQLKTSDQKILRGFELFTDRGLQIPVKAEIRGNVIYITPPACSKPKLLLYAWKPFTRANLVNGAELPASTFSIPIN
ncbi:GDSL-type esterase/lipase family protein [Pedobacter sp.]|jgi:sialate O-acetylesterase|uniref:GDSL-type esterase/lipase family protein n=1 Tax=Pedobacter sp. TaxID=1411316 RepID=UPI002C8F1665|nr:GDSL-type esterase/lipase family protein [Pedobacter sp.]HWW40225.1 GDSL-type esterase/lipase family protein [Pedobacter sp.]